MKKFLFSLIFVGAWAATLAFYGQQPESFPKEIGPHVSRCSASVQNMMGDTQHFLSAHGLGLAWPWSEQMNLAVMAGFTFLSLWMILSIVFGFRGFFRDFFSFFPLRK
jgi:hypothetical protein